MSKAALMLLVSALLMGPAVATAEPEDHAQAIMELEREWARRVAADDVDWIVAIHLDDARQMPAGAPAAVGLDAIRAAWKSMVETEGLELVWEPSFAKVSTSGDLAYDVGAGTMKTPDGKSVAVKYVVVWERRDGQWKVAVDMFSPDE